MQTIDIAGLQAKKVADRQGLFQKDIVDSGTGATHFTFHLSIMEQGGYGALHSHPHSEHLLVLLDGEIEVRNRSESHRLTPGKALMILPQEEHEVINTHPGTSRYYVVYSPPR